MLPELLTCLALAAGPIPEDLPRDVDGDPLPPGAVLRLGSLRWRSPVPYSGPPGPVSISPDGRFVATTVAYRLAVFDTETGLPVPWAKCERLVRRVSFSPDGKSLFTHEDADLPGDEVPGHRFVWREVGTGRVLREMKIDRHFSSGPSFGYTADNRFAAALSGDEVVTVWDTSTQRGVEVKAPKFELIHRLAVSGDGKHLVLARPTWERGGAELIDVQSGKELHRLPYPEDDSVFGFKFMTFSPDGKSFYACTDRALVVWDVESGKRLREVTDCHGPLALSADGKVLACGDWHGTRVFEAGTLREVRRFPPLGPHLPAGLALSADGKRLAVTQSSGVWLWDVATGRQLNQRPGHWDGLFTFAFTPAGDQLVSGGEFGAILWDARSGKEVRRFPCHSQGMAAMALSPDGKTLATGDSKDWEARGTTEGKVRLWDLESGKPTRQWVAHLDKVEGLAFSADGKRLASTGSDSRARVWDVETGTRLGQVRGRYDTWTVAFSRTSLFLGPRRGASEVWSPDAKERRVVLAQDDTKEDIHRSVGFIRGPTGSRTLVSVEWKGTPSHPEFRVWDLDGGMLVKTFSVEAQLNGSGAVSADGRFLAQPYVDPGDKARLGVWDLSNGELIGSLGGLGVGDHLTTFSPDSKWLATGATRDGTILLWPFADALLRSVWAETLGETLPPGNRLATPVITRLRDTARAEGAIPRLVADLDSDDFDTREKASAALAKLRPLGDLTLREALRGTLSVEARGRLEQVMAKETGGKSGTASQVRSMVLLLDRLGTLEASQAVEELAGGSEGGTVTKAAQETLSLRKKQ